LADDQRDFLVATARLLEPDYDVVGTACNGQAAVEESRRLAPDVLVIDISMPLLNGIEAAKQVSASGLCPRIVMLTVHEGKEFVRGALLAGAQGYVVKSRLVDDLPIALAEVMAGRKFVSRFSAEPHVV